MVLTPLSLFKPFSLFFFLGDVEHTDYGRAAGYRGRIAPLFPLASRARARKAFRVIKAINRLDGRAAHPSQGRTMIARSRSICARLEGITARCQEPAAPSGPKFSISTIEGLHHNTYGVHEASQVAEKVRLSAIDLPKAPPVRALSLLPPRLQDFYGSPQLLPIDAVPKARTFFAVEDSDYLPLIRRMVDCGMAEVSLETELARYPRFITNGLFAVPKSSAGSQRLIVDCRAGNAHMPRPESPELPDRAALGELILDPDKKWVGGATDLATYFYSLVVEDWMIGLQGLPRVWVPEAAPICGKHGWVHPALRVAAMGNSHSMVIAQSVHRKLWGFPDRGLETWEQRQDDIPSMPNLKEIGLKGDRRASRCSADEISLTVYVDDSFHLGLWDGLNEAQEQFISQVQKSGLQFAFSKWQRPTTEPIDALGWTINLQSGMVRPQESKLQSLIGDTCRAMQRRRLPREVVRSLVGRWSDIFLLRRPLLSVFHSVYDKASGRFVSPLVHGELQLALDLAPMVYRNLFRPFGTIIVAYDASSTGGAVVYARAHSLTVENLSKFEARNCIDNPGYEVSPVEQTASLIACGFENLQWKLAVRKDFRGIDEHINTLECEMLCTALEWLSRAEENLGKRHLFFGDNQAVVYGATKGRSSRPGLQHLLRRAAAYELALDAHLYHAWVPTAINPADEDSRFFEPQAVAARMELAARRGWN